MCASKKKKKSFVLVSTKWTAIDRREWHEILFFLLTDLSIVVVPNTDCHWKISFWYFPQERLPTVKTYDEAILHSSNHTERDPFWRAMGRMRVTHFSEIISDSFLFYIHHQSGYNTHALDDRWCTVRNMSNITSSASEHKRVLSLSLCLP